MLNEDSFVKTVTASQVGSGWQWRRKTALSPMRFQRKFALRL